MSTPPATAPTAPMAGEPAYDDLIQSASGPGPTSCRAPTANPVPRIPADAGRRQGLGPLHGPGGDRGPLLHKARTGEGQFVEVPMLECVTSFLLVEHLYDQTYDPPTGQWGYVRVVNPKPAPVSRPRTATSACSPTPTSSGTSSSRWPASARTIAKGPALSPTIFTPHEAHQRTLRPWWARRPLTKTTQEWLDVLKTAVDPGGEDQPAGGTCRTTPHLKAVDFFQTYEHPTMGGYRQMKPPVKFSRTPSNIRRHPRRAWGEHSEEVLAEIGVGIEDSEEVWSARRPFPSERAGLFFRQAPTMKSRPEDALP